MIENIPAELRALPQWVAAGSDKIPINPRTGKYADSTNPETGGTFAEALHAGKQHIGFILGANDPYTIVDLDDPFERNVKGVKSKIVEGEPDYQEAVERAERHSKILETFNTYAEFSQSGRGYHLVMQGKTPSGARRDKVEIYSTGRYMIFTGNVVNAAPVADCQELLNQLLSEMGKRPTETGELFEEKPTLEDAAIWGMATRASNAEKFIKLCEGEWGEGTSYPSQSEADYALLSMLAFYTRANEQVRRMFRETALGKREKATQNDEYINRSLRRIRAKEAPLVDFSKLHEATEAEQAENPQVPFPLQHLGEILETMGRAICATERTPEALTGCCLLAILSASIGSGLQVQSGPSRTTRGNLYILASAESGSGKSETFRHVARPFLQLEQALLEDWKNNTAPLIATELDVVEADISRLKKRAGKVSGQERQMVLSELQEKQAEFQKLKERLTPLVLSVEDCTVEKLAIMLAASGEQLASLSSDARVVLDNILGRYRDGKMTDESLYLKAYSGEPVRVDRVGRDPVALKSPCLAVLWLVQPDKLDAILGNASLKDGGFMPRLLLCHTNAQPQKIGTLPLPEIPFNVAECYDGLVKALLETFRLSNSPVTIQPEPEAKSAFIQHHDALIDRRLSGGDLHDVRGFVARWNEQAWRIAVCLHAAKHGKDAAGSSLDLETAQRAIALAGWFACQQLEILNASREKVKRDEWAEVMGLLEKHPQGITARNVYRKRIRRTKEEAEALLIEMETAGKFTGKDLMPPGGGHVTRSYVLARK